MANDNYFNLGTFLDDYKNGRIVIDTKTFSKSTILGADHYADREYLREQDTILKRELHMKTNGMTRVDDPYVETTESVSFTKNGERRVTFFRVWFQQVKWDHKRNVAT